MARHIRSANLESRSARLKLAIRWRPYTVRIAPGVRLGYRRKETAGSWSVLASNGKGGSWMKAFATADDFAEANGETIQDFWQAQDGARVLTSGETTVASTEAPITVGEALDRYEADLGTRGAGSQDVIRVRYHLPGQLAKKAVTLLTVQDLRQWRDALLKKKLAPSSVNRVASSLRAALNLVADLDERILSRRAWEVGLKALPDATVARNVVLSADQIRAIVAAAYGISDEFGTLIEVGAVTGARVSQIGRLMAQDAQTDRLIMPTSRKGRGQKKITRRPVAVPEALALRLRQIVARKLGTAPLLTKPDGSPWKKSDHARDFRRAVKAAGLDPGVVTLYALRHSSITRQLLANVPVRLVAQTHDTSVGQIEKHYSAYIVEHGDAISRAAMLDLSMPAGDNVVPFSKG
jgi:integrase